MMSSYDPRLVAYASLAFKGLWSFEEWSDLRILREERDQERAARANSGCGAQSPYRAQLKMPG